MQARPGPNECTRRIGSWRRGFHRPRSNLHRRCVGCSFPLLPVAHGPEFRCAACTHLIPHVVLRLAGYSFPRTSAHSRCPHVFDSCSAVPDLSIPVRAPFLLTLEQHRSEILVVPVFVSALQVSSTALSRCAIASPQALLP